METVTISLLLKVGYALLLAGVGIYMYVLNKKLSELRSGYMQMGDLIRKFNDSIQIASNIAQSLKKSAKESEPVLGEKLKRCEVLRDELTFLLDRGDKLAGLLEEGISEARRKAKRKNTSLSVEEENEEDNELIRALKDIR
jgi:hypothetical protein